MSAIDVDSRFDACLSFTLKEEGGWSDNPADPGGATMKGVTLKTFRYYKKDQSLTKADLRNISDEDLHGVYRTLFWTPLSGDNLPSGVDLMVFDFGLNAGGGRSARMLQTVVGAVADGNIGPKTIALVNSVDASTLVSKLADQQEAYYKSLPTFSVFGEGWTNRKNSREAAAHNMIPASSAPVATQPAKSNWLSFLQRRNPFKR